MPSSHRLALRAILFFTLLPGCTSSPRPECGEPLALEHATVTVSESAEDLVASYTCDPGYAFAPNEPYSVCEPGQTEWARPSGACVTRLVRDPATGLDWERVPGDAKLNWQRAMDRCEALELDGGGWRLPTIRELTTLYDFDRTDDEEPIARFDDGRAWSSTANETRNVANLLDTVVGTVWTGHRDNQELSRCVRGAELPGPSWSSNGDGTATDHTTGLIWQSTLSNTTPITLDAARAHCAGLTLRGGGFRVPTMHELISTIDFYGWYASVDGTFLTDAPEEPFWTSSFGSRHVWHIDFDGVSFVEGALSRVRCVKDL